MAKDSGARDDEETRAKALQAEAEAAEASDDDDDEDDDEARASAEADEPKADPNTPRNRAERRAAAKAARRGRNVQLADGSLINAEEGAGPLDPDGGLAAPTTSMGGNPRQLDEDAAAGVGRRPRVPPRTMSKGTGDIEGVPDWARGAGDWLSARRRVLGLGVAVVLAAVVGTLGFQRYSQAREGRAADAYAEALQVYTTPIRPDGDAAEATPAPAGPRFRTLEERLRASVEKFRRVQREFPSSRVAPVARLNQATALYLLGRYQEAKEIFQQLRGADTAGLEARVVEGIANCKEALGDLDGALQSYRELQDMAGGTVRDEAQYALARLHIRRNDAAQARTLLRGVVERTRNAVASDPTASIQQELNERAVAMLREVSPDDPLVQEIDRQRTEREGHGHGNDPNPLRGLPPELLERLRGAAGRSGRVPGGPGTLPVPQPMPGPGGRE